MDIMERTLGELIDEAISNGRMDENEFKLLEQVSTDVAKYMAKLEIYKAKGAITKAEGKILRYYKQNLIDNAGRVLIEEPHSDTADVLIDRLINIVSTKYKKY